MKSWIKRTLFGLFGASIAVGGLSACSHYRHEGPGWQRSAEDQARMRDRVIERVSAKLELDAQQKQKLVALADKLHEQRQVLLPQGADPRAQAQQLVAGDKFDRAKAQALVSEKTAAVNARSPEVIAALGDFYDSLNPAQQAKVREFMQRRHGGHWWHRG
ncbi:Spy/CpxP family protein refolding chaperone [Caenimonas terrae]|uniref:Spy/CpxP family protein refolding chaperone n=1 Tax=Caenimonas terrae TaxID=696074 RepID=A0ABW0NKT2_9BURK